MEYVAREPKINITGGYLLLLLQLLFLLFNKEVQKNDLNNATLLIITVAFIMKCCPWDVFSGDN